ncbi:MAG: hypothetical protein JKX68_09750 [Flavobacteriales bacterium]|nr:hypothetical protein [Flavobacteriales bacterium]
MTDFLYGLGDFFTAFFELFKKLGNIPNYCLIALAFGLLFWWMKLQKDYNAEAASNPNQLK